MPSPPDGAIGQLAVVAQLIAPLCGVEATPTAARLIRNLGSIAALLRAPAAQVTEIVGDHGEVSRMIESARSLIREGVTEELRVSHVSGDDPGVRGFLVQELGHLRHEVLVAIFADRASRYIDHQVIATGTETQLRIDKTALLRRAIALGAYGLLIAHNHPSGTLEASASDVRATRLLVEAGKVVSVTLIDHLIVCGERVLSLKQKGVL